MKTYMLNPNMTFATLTTTAAPRKPADRQTEALVNALLPAPTAKAAPKGKAPIVVTPPPQPLPIAQVAPAKPLLKLGLDVPLEFIMAVAQKDHTSPQSPRKFAREQLVEQVRKWVAE